MLTTDQKGAVAETAVAHAAVKLGLGVSRPVNEGERYDLILDLHHRLIRVQVKWAPQKGDVVLVRCQSSRRTRDGLTSRPYSSEDIDALAAYCNDLDRCFLLPMSLVARRRQVNLRLAPTLNSQRAAILWASEFDFKSLDWDRLEGPLGAVAQLEERWHGMPEARGSSPLSSTSTSGPGVDTIGSHEFRNHFGYHLEQAAAGNALVITRHGTPYAELGPPRRADGGLSATVAA